MKRNDVTALHDKSVSELQKQLTDLQKKLATAKLQQAVGKLTSTAQLKVLSDDIARVKTVLQEQVLVAGMKNAQ